MQCNSYTHHHQQQQPKQQQQQFATPQNNNNNNKPKPSKTTRIYHLLVNEVEFQPGFLPESSVCYRPLSYMQTWL